MLVHAFPQSNHPGESINRASTCAADSIAMTANDLHRRTIATPHSPCPQTEALSEPDPPAPYLRARPATRSRSVASFCRHHACGKYMDADHQCGIGSLTHTPTDHRSAMLQSASPCSMASVREA